MTVYAFLFGFGGGLFCGSLLWFWIIPARDNEAHGSVDDAIRAARNSAFEAAAMKCDELADLREQGAGEREPGHRLRQAARNIRALKHDRNHHG